MQLNIIDQTRKSGNKPPEGALAAIAAAGQRVANMAARAYGEYTKRIMEDLDGYPVFLVDDLPEAPGALAYHDNDPSLGPYSRVGVGTVLDAGGTWLIGAFSVVNAALHEVLETLGDPIANRWAQASKNWNVAQELCDPVQDLVFTVHVSPAQGAKLVSVDVPDFVLPSWFNPFGEPPFDQMGLVAKPFDYSNGYVIVQQAGVVVDLWGKNARADEVLTAARRNPRSRLAERGGVTSS